MLDLLKLSDKYRFKELFSNCQEFIEKKITIEDCLEILDNGIRLQNERVIETSWRIIDEQTEKILTNPKYYLIGEKTMELLLSRHTLNCKEIDLFRFLVNWGKHKQKLSSNASLKNIISPFFQYIRFPLMSFKELIREVRPLGVIKDSQYIEALEFNGDKEFIKQKTKGNKTQFQERKREVLFIPGPNYMLSDANTVAVKTCSNGWNTTCVSNLVSEKKVHKWSLKILTSEYSNIMIGIVPHSIDQLENRIYSKQGWFLCCRNGNLFSGPSIYFYEQPYYSSKIFAGANIDVELNLSLRTIRYFLDGKDLGIAYSGIPDDQPLRLAVLFCEKGDSVKLLSYQCSK